MVSSDSISSSQSNFMTSGGVNSSSNSARHFPSSPAAFYMTNQQANFFPSSAPSSQTLQNPTGIINSGGIPSGAAANLANLANPHYNEFQNYQHRSYNLVKSFGSKPNYFDIYDFI